MSIFPHPFNSKYLVDASGTQGAAREYLLAGSTWAPGVYTVRLTSAGQVTNSKRVLVH